MQRLGGGNVPCIPGTARRSAWLENGKAPGANVTEAMEPTLVCRSIRGIFGFASEMGSVAGLAPSAAGFCVDERVEGRELS